MHTHSNTEPLDVVLLALLYDTVKVVEVMRLSVGHDHHDLLDPITCTALLREGLFPFGNNKWDEPGWNLFDTPTSIQ